MDKLEHYLDQVCRGIGGPRSMRQHVRRELREHIMDAVAEHQDSGMTAEQALDRALEDFGGPEQVRSELEATHGHRVLTVVIDKAMQWKEKTMKAKWLWTTWAHLALAMVIAIGMLFIVSAALGVVPQFKLMESRGWLAVWDPNPTIKRPDVEAWCGPIIDFMVAVCFYWARWVIPLGIAWVLFEWRAKSENKTLIRLAGMGTLALATTVAAVTFLAAIALPFFPEMLVMHTQPPEPAIREQVAAARASINKLDEALAKNDWPAIHQEIRHLRDSIGRLMMSGAAAPVITVMQGKTNIEDVREKLTSAMMTLQTDDMQGKINDAQTLEAATREIRAMLDQIPAPASAPAR